MKLQKSSVLLVAALSASGQALAAPYAYVPNEKDGTVSVIDTATDKLMHTLPNKGSMGNKIQGLALDSTAKTLFVVDAESGALKVVNLTSHQVEKKKYQSVRALRALAYLQMVIPWQFAWKKKMRWHLLISAY